MHARKLNSLARLGLFLAIVMVLFSRVPDARAQDGTPPPDAHSTTGPTPKPGVSRGEVLIAEATPVLLNVPAFLWKDGCGPTAAGMLIAYWDGRGYDDLIPGNASAQTTAVNARISSTGSYNDYSLPLDDSSVDWAPKPDRSELPVGDEHTNDSLADLLKTSQSARDNYYGWGWFSDMIPGLQQYVQQMTPGYSAVIQNQYWDEFTWEKYRAEIDAGRPVILLVDTDADGSTDHFVPGIGYDDSSGTRMYAVRDTWDLGVHWYNFASIGAGRPWGIFGATLFQLKPLQSSAAAPTGAIETNYTPTYSWSATTTATWYYLYVNGPGGANVLKKWYSAAEAGCASGTGTCSVTPTTPLGGGAHKWWVQTYNAAGYGPWSAEMNFSTTIPTPPAATTLVGPSGAISDTTPAYTWNEVSAATWYYLYVKAPNGNAVIKTWYTSAQANCNGTICSVTPTTELGGGAHTWWVQTYNSAGHGLWSSEMIFSLPVPTVPGAATLTAPSGSILTNTPTFTWNEVLAEGTAESAATWYYLYVSGPSGNAVITTWYQASVICSSGTCEVPSSVTLGPGTHKWWVRTYNAVGYGSWSAEKTFSTPIPWPEAPTPVSPNGSITDLTPTFTWTPAGSGAMATWYLITVHGPNGKVYDQWFDASLACSGGSCSGTTTKSVIPGSSYTWWVRGWNAAGYSVWSSNGMSFTPVSVGGFNSQFNGDATGWTAESGAWSLASGTWYTTLGASNSSRSASYSTSYTNFDYRARLYRAGCVWCDNSLYVRGTPSPLSTAGYWNNGYQFTYAHDSTFSVWKVVGGSWSLIQDYTYTAAILPNTWNTLRVVVSNNNFYFYINGTLVWTGADTSFASGRVGFSMENFEDFAYGGMTPGDQLYVDWATLSSYAEDLLGSVESVSAEQQALNDSANANGSDKAENGRPQP